MAERSPITRARVTPIKYLNTVYEMLGLQREFVTFLGNESWSGSHSEGVLRVG